MFLSLRFSALPFTQLKACFNRKKRERLKIVMVKVTIPQEFLQKTRPDYALNIYFQILLFILIKWMCQIRTKMLRSVDLERKLASRNISQKTNEGICFSILTTRKYLKLEFRFQVFRSHQDRKTNLFVCFLGEVTARLICFEIYWPLGYHSVF